MAVCAIILSYPLFRNRTRFSVNFRRVKPVDYRKGCCKPRISRAMQAAAIAAHYPHLRWQKFPASFIHINVSHCSGGAGPLRLLYAGNKTAGKSRLRFMSGRGSATIFRYCAVNHGASFVETRRSVSKRSTKITKRSRRCSFAFITIRTNDALS